MIINETEQATMESKQFILMNSLKKQFRSRNMVNTDLIIYITVIMCFMSGMVFSIEL